MEKQKRVVAIHDLSCMGRSSITVALPILSAAGYETGVLPTALLSTHTGDFSGYTYLDLTEEMKRISDHWKSLGIKFDAIYSGFLGSYQQIEVVSKFFDGFKKENTIIMVDPVMGDKGVLYPTYTEEMVIGMRKLCQRADIILPNLTEAAFLLNEKFARDGFNKDYIEQTLQALSGLGAKKVVLTGVSLEIGKSGAASYDRDTGEVSYATCPKIPGFFHGTGDVFASVLLSGMLKGFTLPKAVEMATELTYKAILKTDEIDSERRFGLCFELVIDDFIKRLEWNEE